jgi:hypothetical protein
LNSGNVPILDFEHMDVFLFQSDAVPTRIRYSSGGGENTWQKKIEADSIHPNQWDPGEELNLSVSYSGSTPGAVQITAANGVSAYYTIP